MTSYTVRPSITANNIREATHIALATYPDSTTHILIDRTDDPHTFTVRTKSPTRCNHWPGQPRCGVCGMGEESPR